MQFLQFRFWQRWRRAEYQGERWRVLQIGTRPCTIHLELYGNSSFRLVVGRPEKKALSVHPAPDDNTNADSDDFDNSDSDDNIDNEHLNINRNKHIHNRYGDDRYDDDRYGNDNGHKHFDDTYFNDSGQLCRQEQP